jgi:hypothetical protein
VIATADGGALAVGRFRADFAATGFSRLGSMAVRYDAGGSNPTLGPELLRFEATALAARADGSADVAGLARCASSLGSPRDVPCGALLARLEPSGTLSGGPFPVPPTSLEPQPRRYGAIAARSDGATLAFGHLPSLGLVSRRYLSDGHPDRTYGACGMRSGPGDLTPAAAAHAGDGGLLIAGTTPAGSPVVERWTERAARTGRYGERLATVRSPLVGLETLLRRGARVRLRFTRRARVSLRLRVAARTARRGHVPRTIARRRVTVRTCQRLDVTMRPAARIVRRLRRLARLRGSVKVVLTAEAGGRRLALVRVV